MTPKRSSASLELSTHLNGSLDEQLSKLRHQIVEQSFALAEQRAKPSALDMTDDHDKVLVDISLEDVSEAFKTAVGRHIVPVRETTFFELFPPFTCLCFFLCFLFGALGLFAQHRDGDMKGGISLAAGFLDIAKIFAGAIVGSTASNALATRKSRQGLR